jgi:hypothetical protein
MEIEWSEESLSDMAALDRKSPGALSSPSSVSQKPEPGASSNSEVFIQLSFVAYGLVTGVYASGKTATGCRSCASATAVKRTAERATNLLAPPQLLQ